MRTLFHFLLCIFLLISCESKQYDWKVIFDGTTINGWHRFNGSNFPKNWKLINGEFRSGQSRKGILGTSLVYRHPFKHFELEFEWKLKAGGNSGVMYHVQEGPTFKHAFETGPEYQLLDDMSFQNISPQLKLASNCGLFAADTEGVVKKAGKWNISKIICSESMVEHWLNGKKVLEFIPQSEEWKKNKSKSKWVDYPRYGTAKSGVIALQDHGYPVAFKNIRVRELD